ncbi:hypothetical protein C0Z16_24745 [Paraburkholderia rhynchosiae]|uniref:Tyr recombinase domain-containing protein n=1 Tax=Paraburkholderia rhynchosiae TaxID=487049 RepID=A0ABX4V1K7_9BURK|nr:hypothetical protein C0Z16_24745 [Paraburkholderia rhynchosiae]
MVDLHARARRLGPPPGLRGAVQETLFGLIAATGVRIGEALSLRNGDLHLKDGMLTIRRTQFRKSRQIPVHPSTGDALRRYRRLRDLAERAPTRSPARRASGASGLPRLGRAAGGQP